MMSNTSWILKNRSIVLLSCKKNIITVQNIPINIVSTRRRDFISLTDMAKGKDGQARATDIIKNWMRARSSGHYSAHSPNKYNIISSRCIKVDPLMVIIVPTGPLRGEK